MWDAEVSRMTACPPGSYCVDGVAWTCSYPELLNSTLYMAMPAPTVVERLVRYLDPYTGNHCPEGSTVPYGECPGGSYCPDPATALECPRGSFCKALTVVPRRCLPLTACPSGVSEPTFHGTALLAGVLLAAACAAVAAGVSCGRRPQRDGPRAAAAVAVAVACPVDVGDDIWGAALPPPDEASAPPEGGLAAFRQLVRPVRGLAFEDLGVRDPRRPHATWLASTSGSFMAGRLNAVMGSSGCGKSLTVALLSGRVPRARVTGRVIVDGRAIDVAGPRAEHDLRERCAVVPQDDVLYPSLTVRESLEYAAALKLPPGRARRRAVVDAVLGALGISGIASRPVGDVERRGISGGQRKRVSVGTEVVGLPSVLFMDEPTSGLDATASQGLLAFARALTDAVGMTVVAVVHQPRYASFGLFDNVLLLGRAGAVFCGPPSAAMLYFQAGLLHDLHSDENPADELVDAIGASDQAELADRWRSRGVAWTRRLAAEYPLLPYALDQGVAFEPGLGLPDGDKEVLTRAVLDRRFATSVARMALFARVPAPVVGGPAVGSPRAIALAYEFGRRLMDRAGVRRRDGRVFDACLRCVDAKARRDAAARAALRGGTAFSERRGSPWAARLAVVAAYKALTTLRSAWVIQTTVLVVAAFVVGANHGSAWRLEAYAGDVAAANVVLAVVSTVMHVRTFVCDRVAVAREVGNGTSASLFFVAYNLSDLPWLLLFPLLFYMPYYLMLLPSSGFGGVYLAGLLTCWWTSGLAYAVAALPIAAEWATLVGVFVVVVLGAFLQGFNPPISPWLFVSFNRWAMEALAIAEAAEHQRLQPNVVYVVFERYGICGFDADTPRDAYLAGGFDVAADCKKYVDRAYLALFGSGAALRLVAWALVALRLEVAVRGPLRHLVRRVAGAC